MKSPKKFYKRRSNVFILGLSTNNKELKKVPTKAVAGTCKSEVSDVLSEFCSKTTIHGIKYFGKRYIIERVWWGIAIGLSIGVCAFWIYGTWNKNNENTVVLRYDKTPRSVNKIPFPVVTICSSVKTAVKKFNYTDVYRSLLQLDGNHSRIVTSHELKIMKAINQVCEQSAFTQNISKLFPDDTDDNSILDIIDSVAPDFSETFVLCKLFDRWKNCSEMLTPIITEKGKCYSFNSLNLLDYLKNDLYFYLKYSPFYKRLTHWSLEEGYTPDQEKTYPHRVNGAGKMFGITLILKVNNYDIDYTCSGPVQGFKITFHTPVELPHVVKHTFELSPGYTSTFMVEPKLVETTVSARKHPPHIRQCYFNSERKLRFFKYYTQRNCEFECLSNYTLSQCGCVNFAELRTNTTKVCGPRQGECSRKAEQYFYRSDDLIECNCLQPCVSLSYDAHSVTADYDLATAISKSTIKEEFTLDNARFSRFAVSFKEETFTATKRVENRNWIDFIASAGGLLGLCLGASLLSIFEMIYYLTLRIFVAYRNSRKCNEAKQQILFPGDSH